MKNNFNAPIKLPDEVNELTEKLVQMYLNDEVSNENILEILDLFKTEEINKPYIEKKLELSLNRILIL